MTHLPGNLPSYKYTKQRTHTIQEVELKKIPPSEFFQLTSDYIDLVDDVYLLLMRDGSVMKHADDSIIYLCLCLRTRRVLQVDSTRLVRLASAEITAFIQG